MVGRQRDYHSIEHRRQLRWRKGLQVTVRLRDGEQDPDVWKETIVDVPRYEQGYIGFFAMHFYPDESVKVLVTTKSDEYPGYPYPRPPQD